MSTKKLVFLSLFSAVAYVLVLLIRIPFMPVVPGFTLSYEPKDTIIVIGGFVFGPLASMMISVVVSFIEMITISTTGPIGLAMNIIASCAFACTAAIVYKYKKTLAGAAIGLALGMLAMTAVMLLWNYIMVPLYTPFTRDAVLALLLPVFAPFNLIKSGLNAGIVMLIYKPITTALRQAKVLSTPVSAKTGIKILRPDIIIVSLFIILTCILLILSYMDSI